MSTDAKPPADAPSPEGHAEQAAPVLRVVRGTPDAAELAALVAVVAAASASADQPPPAGRSAWADPRRSVRAPLPAGGWRTSSAPR